MSLSILVNCPHCHAEGNLADPALFGQAISCPVCQQVFIAPTPNVAVAPEPAAYVPVSELPTTAPDVASLPSSPAAAGLPEPVTVLSVAAEIPAEGSIQTAPVPVPEMTPVVDGPAVVSPESAVADPAIGIMPQMDPTGAVPPSQSWATGSIPTVVAVPIVAVPVPTVSTPLPVDSSPQAFAFGVPHAEAPVPEVVPVAGAYTGQATGQSVFPVTGGEFPVPVGHAFDGPLPEFMAPPPPPGAAEVMFAQSLPEPVARGAVQPPKLPSKTVIRVAVGSISLIVVVATVVFLLGDPLRRAGKDSKPKGPDEMNPIARPYTPEPGGESKEDFWARVKASQSNGGQSGKENR